ncbi:hypothetical protein [Pantoea sp. USHLN256]|uniref:hypothetical protein n=1 Tax=Pantoea sp. USHLN256 TaxID=3081293 RepID=UPI00301B2E94
MNDWLTMEYDELLNEAIMSETPILVVEGVDDVPVYENLCFSLGGNHEVIAVQNLKGKHEGSKSVVSFIEEVNMLGFSGELERYILGVIDRDARFYRGELNALPGLFVLKWYSMESHFITHDAIKAVLIQCTGLSRKLITDELINEIYDEIIELIMPMYFVGLESLRNACELEYASLASYSMSVDHLRNTGAFDEILAKKQELGEFAFSKSIDFDVNGLFEVCKGKWVLNEFSKVLIRKIKNLKLRCGAKEIECCQFCHEEPSSLCSYKFESNYDTAQIRSIIKRHEGFTMFDYLKQRLSYMV